MNILACRMMTARCWRTTSSTRPRNVPSAAIQRAPGPSYSTMLFTATGTSFKDEAVSRCIFSLDPIDFPGVSPTFGEYFGLRATNRMPLFSGRRWRARRCKCVAERRLNHSQYVSGTEESLMCLQAIQILFGRYSAYQRYNLILCLPWPYLVLTHCLLLRCRLTCGCTCRYHILCKVSVIPRCAKS